MKRRWMICAVLGSALVYLSASALLAKQGIVKTRTVARSKATSPKSPMG